MNLLLETKFLRKKMPIYAFSVFGFLSKDFGNIRSEPVMRASRKAPVIQSVIHPHVPSRAGSACPQPVQEILPRLTLVPDKIGHPLTQPALTGYF